MTRAGPHSEATLPDTQNPKLQGKDGTHNAYISMGETAENVAERYGVKREQQDEYASRSQDLAVKAQESGFFDSEIIPVETPGRHDRRRRTTARAPARRWRSSPRLKPVFREGGTVTAGNACPLNDGAAAMLLMSADRAKELGLKPRARIIASATSGNEPEYMGVAPIGAIQNVLKRAGMSIGDIDVVELNEAFAAQVIPIMNECNIPLEKLNPHGGAIALGHPFGHDRRPHHDDAAERPRDDGQDSIGLETMCVAGGQGMAMIVERLN